MIKNPSCPTCCDGEILIETSGPPKPLIFSIDSGITWYGPDVFLGSYKTFTNLCAGDYHIRVNLNGNLKSTCVATKKVTLLYEVIPPEMAACPIDCGTSPGQTVHWNGGPSWVVNPSIVSTPTNTSICSVDITYQACVATNGTTGTTTLTGVNSATGQTSTVSVAPGLSRVRTADGTDYASIDTSPYLISFTEGTAPASIQVNTSDGIHFPDVGTYPVVTTDRLYNDGSDLTFNGFGWKQANQIPESLILGRSTTVTGALHTINQNDPIITAVDPPLGGTVVTLPSTLGTRTVIICDRFGNCSVLNPISIAPAGGSSINGAPGILLLTTPYSSVILTAFTDAPAGWIITSKS